VFDLTQEKTKGKLLCAAIKVFAEKGYDGATVRDICSRVGANVAAVNYYFGSKESLYRHILEMLFTKGQESRRERLATQREGQTPEERLRHYIERVCRWTFGVSKQDIPSCAELLSNQEAFRLNELLIDLRKIFLREMTRATTPELDEKVYQLLRDDTAEIRSIIRDIIGQDAPEDVVRDCDCSIIGQILYYDTHWSVHLRLNPDRPSMQEYLEQLVDHITCFSLAGLEATKKALEDGKIPLTPPDRKQKSSVR
jgi:AcrR family transcriptional regulator